MPKHKTTTSSQSSHAPKAARPRAKAGDKDTEVTVFAESNAPCVTGKPPIPSLTLTGTEGTVDVPALPEGASFLRLELRNLPNGDWIVLADGVTTQPSVGFSLDLCKQYELRWVAGN